MTVKEFVKYWTGRGYEKGESQKFWLMLLEVLGMENPGTEIEFEDQVKLDSTSFIDGMIPSTHVMIEQKSLGKDLDAPIRQSDGVYLTPFQQAKRYSAELPYSKRPRWIVTSNFAEFRVYDMEKPGGTPEIILLKDLEHEIYRLSFIVNAESEHLKRELKLSLEAGEIVGLIYDALKERYRDPESDEASKSLNVLCVRLVFCLYAEDAGIFGHRDMFRAYLSRFQARDLRRALIDLFQVLDQKPEERDPYLDDELAAFPYVNGGLFEKENIEIPQMTDEIRDLLLDKASDFDWSEISPTIFGAVFESTLNSETRRSGGMHYTTIENIHKVIDPLFLDDLTHEYEQILYDEPESPEEKRARDTKLKELAAKEGRALAEGNFAERHRIQKQLSDLAARDKRQNKKSNIQKLKELEDFQEKLSRLSFLDPACGSGNFLTETYLSLRRLENRILKEKIALAGHRGQIELMFQEQPEIERPIRVMISQFYGIEINDFAVAVAKTALWIAESQMMKETEEILHTKLDFLPLKTNAYIIRGNALRVDWNEVVPKEKLDYIMGNPPFVGAYLMTEAQREDLRTHFGEKFKGIGSIDYVAGWYKVATDYIKDTRIKCALVSTNSISQGEVAGYLWPSLFESGIIINFAYRTFRWDSEANVKAHVHCVIVGFSMIDTPEKVIFDQGTVKRVHCINAYLLDAPNVVIVNRSKPLCDVHVLTKGNQPTDNGHLILSEEERAHMLAKYPESIEYIKRYVGARDFLNNDQVRYCLWLKGVEPARYYKNKDVLARLQAVKEFREKSTASPTRKSAETPYRFFSAPQTNETYLIIPRHSSENRRYIPIGFMAPDIIASDSCSIVCGAGLYEFGVLESNVHMAWMRTVAGRLKSDYRYSGGIVYNNFPWPDPTPEIKKIIEETAQGILDARDLYPDSSLADLYNPLTMPPELIRAHQKNDVAVMKAYGFPIRDFTEEDCVAELFKLYKEKASF